MRTDAFAFITYLMARAIRTMVFYEAAKLLAKVAILSTVLTSVVFAANDEGLAKLHRVVDAACECAAGQHSGMAAALSCTQGPREFGRLKVMHRAGWDDAARARAGDLKKVIQSCLSNALSAGAARERLGLPPIRVDGSIPEVYWKPIAIALLLPRSKLVRLVHRTRAINAGQSKTLTSIGIVQARGAEQLQLLRARRDGGGSQSIVLHDIEQAWVMILRE